MTAIATSYESLLKVRKGAVDIVDVPEFGFVAVTGTGEPGGAEFTEAVQALYSVSYGAHFRLKKLTGEALGGIDGMRDPAHLGAALGPGGGFPLQAAGGMWHRAAAPLVFAVVFDVTRQRRLRAIRRPWGRVYKSMTLPEPAGKQVV
jgi:hypothetical protein